MSSTGFTRDLHPSWSWRDSVPTVRILPVILIFCFLGLGDGLWGQTRLWRDTGGRTLTATYLASNDDHTFLKLDSGKISEIPLGLLSNRDLEFVRAKRAALSAQGIRFEAPLVWESYRSKKVTGAQAEKLGYYPLESDGSEGTLNLQFRRYGPPPSAKSRVVLRLHTAGAGGAGTSSAIRVYAGKMVMGSINGARAGDQIDIPLKPSVLAEGESISLTVRCGTDAVFVRSKNSGKGPRLVVLK